MIIQSKKVWIADQFLAAQVEMDGGGRLQPQRLSDLPDGGGGDDPQGGGQDPGHLRARRPPRGGGAGPQKMRPRRRRQAHGDDRRQGAASADGLCARWLFSRGDEKAVSDFF